MKKKRKPYTKRVIEQALRPDTISQESMSRLTYLAQEVDSIFNHGIINPDTLKIELDMQHLARVWQLVGYIYALEERARTEQVSNQVTQ